MGWSHGPQSLRWLRQNLGLISGGKGHVWDGRQSYQSLFSLPSQPQLILKNTMMESPQAVSDLYLVKCIANYICIYFIYTESPLTSQDGKVYSQFMHTCIVCIIYTITMEKSSSVRVYMFCYLSYCSVRHLVSQILTMIVTQKEAVEYTVLLLFINTHLGLA